MAETTITLRSYDDAGAEYQELAEQLRAHAAVTLPPPTGAPRYTGVEIIVALGAAGAFTAVYQIIKAYLDRHSSAEVTIEHEDRHVNIKGYSAPDAQTLIREIYPEGSDA